MTNYERGYQFELRVWKHLEEQGFYVMRSAGSRGVVDLAAFEPVPGRAFWGPGEVWLIACRTEKSRYLLKEQLAISDLARHLGHRAFLAYREPRPPWKLHLDELTSSDLTVWNPSEEELPPWYEEEEEDATEGNG